jgi:hypothetical protein
MMTQMFLSPSKPFYQSTINMGLEPIPRDIYIDFAQRMFLLDDKQITSEVVGRVYDMCRGITWFMQMLLNEMYSLTPAGGRCEADSIEAAVRNVVQVQEPFYREMLAALPTKQKSLLFAILKEDGAENITSGAFIQKHKLHSASSVQSALKGLHEKDIVTEDNGIWRVYDIFLSQYLLTM